MKTAMQVTCTVAICLGLCAAHGDGQSSTPTTRPGISAPAATQPATTSAPVEEVSMSFKNMQIEQLCAFLSEKLKKPVIYSESIKSKKVTIICKKKLPLEEALPMLRQALLAQDIMVEEVLSPPMIHVRPVSEVMRTDLVRVPADQSVGIIEDALKIVAKEFLIKHYDVRKMVAIIKPMLPSFGYIMADPNTRKMVITDTVANLLRIEQVVASMDVPLAQQTLTEIIEVKYGDAVEIVAILRWLIAGRMGINVKEITTTSGEPAKASGGSPRSSGPPVPGRPGFPSRSSGGGGAAEIGVTEIEPAKTPVTLVPHVSRNWIIAVAPAGIMEQIRVWVRQFDKAREVEKDYELYDVEEADINDLARQIERTIESMPRAELREATHVVPVDRSKKLIVFGSKSGRELVRNLLAKLDVESARKRTRKTIRLKHAGAEEMAERIETLFSELEISYKSDWYTSYRRDPQATKVTVVPDKRRNTITVITDPDTMKEIEKLIAEEDKPVDPGEVKPKVYELEYVNAGDMKDLLSEMFGAKERRARRPWYYFFGEEEESQAKAVGRLLGQFTFQVLPNSNILIVNTKSVANYEVIDRLIKELDRPQRAGVPLIIELKHANAEDLCEQLNALLAEPSTLARIRRASRGLLEAVPSARSERSKQSAPSGSGAGQPKAADPGVMEFWWQGFKPPPGGVATSNLIGQIRFVPVNRRNALMVLAPKAYSEPIAQLVEELDQPGRQVMIHARIGEIQHDDQTTLGLRIASDPSILPPADTAVGGSGTASYGDAFFSGTLVLGAKANVSALIHLLIKDFGMKILTEPTITTSDNQASAYFDGQDVPVQTEARTSAEGTQTVTEIDYEEVGTRVRVRPHITVNGSVDLMINLEISRIVPGSTALGNFIFDRREVTTHVIVRDGQTIMLSGIIRQEEFNEIRKVPLLGDIPLIGALFRSIDKGTRNRELVLFITPRVMGTPEEIEAVMEKPRATLHKIEESMQGREPLSPAGVKEATSP